MSPNLFLLTISITFTAQINPLQGVSGLPGGPSLYVVVYSQELSQCHLRYACPIGDGAARHAVLRVAGDAVRLYPDSCARVVGLSTCNTLVWAI